MTCVLIANDVVQRLAELTDREDPAGAAIRGAIALMVTHSPRRPDFPGFQAEMGPLIAVLAGGFRLEIEELSADLAARNPRARPGCLYVYAAVSPKEQEEERHLRR